MTIRGWRWGRRKSLRGYPGQRVVDRVLPRVRGLDEDCRECPDQKVVDRVLPIERM